MRKLLVILGLITFSMMSWAQGQGYRNPIIPGYHPDPSVCRVGDDFYLVNSSFQYFPGVPVFHSRDLVNWEQIGNVLDRESQLPLNGASSWLGIYAPTIRYHEGTFYMITTNVGNGGNFLVTATDPRGPWSEPVWLEQQGIDPSLWFENGKCYMVSNPDNGIWLCQINPKTGKQLTKSKLLWQGTGGRYPEGPHIYKKDGWYYLLISEGGTELAHKLTIARSRHIEGPYEANPANPILTHCNMAGQSSQIQGTGHGDFVQAADGSWWIVFLAYRNFGGSYHHLGRETFLAPVEWKTGEWPVVNGGQPVDTLMRVATLPQVPMPQAPEKADFAAGKLGPEWMRIQNPIPENYQFVDGKLRLFAANMSLTENDRPTFVGRRQESAVFTLDTQLDFEESVSGDEAGVSIYQIHEGHLDFGVRKSGGSLHPFMRLTMKNVEHSRSAEKIIGTEIKLRVTSDGFNYYLDYAVDGQPFQRFDQVSCSLLSTEVVGGFTGVVMGMYAWHSGRDLRVGKSYADFGYFNINTKTE